MDDGRGPSRVKKLSQLLEEAHTERAVYEKDVLQGVWDEQWPTWYADYLFAHGILDMGIFDSQSREPQEGLALLLAEADRAHQRTSPQTNWPDFYARYMLGIDHVESASSTETASR